MQLVGYTGSWTTRPGDAVSLHVSSRSPSYRVSVLRMRHGDDNPSGPGFRATRVPSSIDGSYAGSWHDVPSGSCGIVEEAGELLNGEATSIAVWVYPTAVEAGVQTIVSRGIEGFSLSIAADGRPRVALGKVEAVGARPLVSRQWYLLVARIDRRAGTLELVVRPRTPWPSKVEPDDARASFANAPSLDGPLVMAAQAIEGSFEAWFNGKIDSPMIFPQAIDEAMIGAILRDETAAEPTATWDFGADHTTLIVPSTPAGYDLRLIGMPMRAVTGHRADGTALRPSDRPEHYTAIHFHDDDKHDAGWPEAARLDIPADWPSGIYAFHIEAEDGVEDYVPFFVLPPRGAPTASIAFLVPTFSYIAYGNMHSSHVAVDPELLGSLPSSRPPQDMYVAEQRLNSTYDVHRTDGSGVAYISRLLPQVHVRPKFNWANGSPHQFNADLYLVDWLEEKGFPHDILTDEALHHEGSDLLMPYNVVVTGTHPEYWSGAMLDALENYLTNGGRVMYMGGNGFYWVTSVHPHAPHVCEVRKYGGTRTWTAEPEERHHSTSGEQGGTWRDRGRTPHKTLGIGFAGQGFGTNASYKRAEASYSGPLANLFDGIEGDVFGDTPSLVLQKGAAGFELDRIDYTLGSPPNTVCLASSMENGPYYQLVYEEAMAYMLPSQLGSKNPQLRSDIAYLEYPGGGEVFSVGSISFCGSLSFNDYDNPISRLTENVLTRFNKSKHLS